MMLGRFVLPYVSGLFLRIDNELLKWFNTG